MDDKPSMPGRIPVLDGLRGLAILAVLCCHVNWAFGGPFVGGRVNGPVAAALGLGWVGVDLFFVLSGFLITGILYEAKGCDGYFRKFYARRTLRIMPLYFGFLAFALTVPPRLPEVFGGPAELSGADVASLGLYFYNFRVATTHHSLSYFHPFWSLAVEEHFYLLWPLAVWALARRPLLKLCLGLAAASFLLRVLVVLSGAWPLSAFFITPCRLDALLAGSFVALARRDPSDWARCQRGVGRLASASGCLLLGLALGLGHFIPDGPSAGALLTVGLTALAAFFAGLLVLAVGAAAGSRARGLLENRALCAVGEYSYAIYVFHSLILTATVTLLPSLRDVPLFLVKPLAVLWVLGTSLVAAWLSYHLYEKHFLQLKRYFEYRGPARVASPVVSQCPSYSNA